MILSLILPALLIQGVLVTYQNGREIGRESYTDDGRALVSEITLAGKRAKVTLTRNPRRVTVEADGKKVVRDVGDDTVALENGSWQAYALVADRFAGAGDETPVKLLVPGQNAVVPATLRVTSMAQLGRHVELSSGSLTVRVDIDSSGQVRVAQVPLQGLEARPLGVVPMLPARRPPPDGVVEEPPVTVERAGATLRGTLWRPARAAATGTLPLVVIVAGSGPTDRDGNDPRFGLRTDTYRLLAAELAARGVASLRYDKRGAGESTLGPGGEAALTIGTFADDAGAMVAWARHDGRFGPVTLLGHSEGGVIGLLLAQAAARAAAR